MLADSFIPLSLSTACLYPLSLRRIIALAAQTGYQGIELEAGGSANLAGGRRVQQWALSAGVRVLSVHQALMDPRGRRDPGILVTGAVDLALETGAPVVVLHSPWETNWDSAGARAWLAALDHAQRRAARADLCITVENMGEHPGMPGRLVLGEFSELLRFAQERDLQITYDTCHAGTLNADLVADLAALGDRLANVHLSDHKPESRFRATKVLDLVFSNHQMPGEGALALRPFLRALTATPYQRAITFEVSPTALGSLLPKRRAARLGQARNYVTQAFSEPTVTATRVAAVAAPAE